MTEETQRAAALDQCKGCAVPLRYVLQGSMQLRHAQMTSKASKAALFGSAAVLSSGHSPERTLHISRRELLNNTEGPLLGASVVM